MKIESVLLHSNCRMKNNSYSCCGLLIDDRLVITVGTILIPFLQKLNHDEDAFLISKFSPELNVLKSLSEATVRVCKLVKSQEKKCVSFESRLVATWNCPLVERSVKDIFYDWTVKHSGSTESFLEEPADGIHTSKKLLSIFAIFQKNDGKVFESKETLKSTLINLAKNLAKPLRGQDVEIISTPFGNENFINSLSRGIVSNVVGLKKCLILTDARTVPGCEGAPIFSTSKKPRFKFEEVKDLLGLVICPLTWWKGEWVGLTIGINLIPVFEKLLKSQIEAPDFVKNSINNSDSKVPAALDESVVLVCSENAWGSGVVLNSNTVITCSHVLKEGKNTTVFYKGCHYPVFTVYRTSDDVAYDLAVLKTQNDTFEKFIEFCEDSPQKGDVVHAVGFPFFSEKDDKEIRPSLSRGCISKANPFMIETTCCIQSGFSGGALLKNGKLLGIIISNAKDMNSGALFPHINFVIPSTVFRDIIEKYLQTNDDQHLKLLKSLDPKVQSVWSLQSSKL